MKDIRKAAGNESRRTEAGDWIYDPLLGRWWQVDRVSGPEDVVIDGRYYRVTATEERCALYGQLTRDERLARNAAVERANRPMTSAGRAVRR